MASRMEFLMSIYFRVLALSCSAQKRVVQNWLSAYLALVLIDMLVQFDRYFRNGWQLNDFQQRQQRNQLVAYAKIVDAMNVAYLLSHMLMVLQALILRNRERRLLAQLPPLVGHTSKVINVRFHVTAECIVTSAALILAIYQSIQSRQLLPNLRYLFNTQAVRARYLQVALLVARLDSQLTALQQPQQRQRCSDLKLRASYAHIVRLARQLSRLYGLSVLQMNVLCIGDFIVVCYAYIILWQLAAMNLSWFLIWQTFYVMLPTIIKIWTLCAVCHNTTQRSQQLLRQIATRGTRGLQRDQVDEFSLQIMQNPVQFAVCDIYQLNLKTMAGMFLFIVETMVIFLQFVELTKQQSG